MYIYLFYCVKYFYNVYKVEGIKFNLIKIKTYK